MSRPVLQKPERQEPRFPDPLAARVPGNSEVPPIKYTHKAGNKVKAVPAGKRDCRKTGLAFEYLLPSFIDAVMVAAVS